MPKITTHGGPSNQYDGDPAAPASTPSPAPASVPEPDEDVTESGEVDDRPHVHAQAGSAEGTGEAPNLGAEE